MADNGGQWLTVAEAALALGVSPRTVRRWAALGHLEADRIRRPYLVMVPGQRLAEAGQRTATPDMTDTVATELEGLRAEIARLLERVQELTQERDYLRALAGSLATGQRLMLEATPRRRWRWPWQREP